MFRGVQLVVCGLAFVFAQAIIAAPADDIKALVEKGDARGAYEFGKKYPDQLGNPAFDFYFGVAAIDSGHAGEGVLALTSCLTGCTLSGVTLGGPTSPTNFGGSCSGGPCSASSPTTPISTAGAGGIFVGPQGAGLAVAGSIASPAPTVAYAAAFKR